MLRPRHVKHIRVMICGTMHCCLSFSKAVSASAWRADQWPKFSCICFTTPSDMFCRQTRQHLKQMQKRVQFQIAAAGMGSKRYARSVASSSILKRPVSGIIRWVAITGGTVRGCQPLQSAAHMPACSACTFNDVPILVLQLVLPSLSIHQPGSRLLGSAHFACTACETSILA